MKGEVWIPCRLPFQLDSKYSEMHLEDFAGQLFLELYNGNLYGGNVTGKDDIE